MVSTRSSSAALATPRTGRSSSPVAAPPSTLSKTLTKTRAARTTAATTTAAAASGGWSHVPTRLSLVWLAVSVPLVFWDMGYVFLRPHSMPGGSLHWPIWSLYSIQAELDYTYGTKAWEAHDGWNAAQSTINVVESFAYIAYLALWYRHAAQYGRSEIAGRAGAITLLIGFSAALTTFIKTVLYWLNEAFSGFANIGHNPPVRLFVYWIIPNGAWIVFPAIMLYTMGADILDGLTRASNPAGSGRGSKSDKSE